MRHSQLLEINPAKELKFHFEVKKKCSSSLQLINKTHEYVAFKIKTTSPKRYSVRPNSGVILPRSKCEATVTMQAQPETPPDMQLRDKFLVQSTVVPFGSAEEDISSSFFSKENGKYLEENKLCVILVSLPDDPPVPQQTNEVLPVEECPSLKQTCDLDEAHDLTETLIKTRVDNLASVQDVEDLKLKIDNLETNLNEASIKIASLQEEKDKLRQELVRLRSKYECQADFPFMFVILVALVGVAIGYLLN